MYVGAKKKKEKNELRFKISSGRYVTIIQWPACTNQFEALGNIVWGSKYHKNGKNIKWWRSWNPQ